MGIANPDWNVVLMACGLLACDASDPSSRVIDAAGTADRLGGELLGSPGAFDHSGCTTEVSLADFDFSGIWHLDLAFDESGTGFGPLVIVGATPQFGITLFGHEADTVTVSETDLFSRKEWMSEQGYHRILAMDVCAVSFDDELRGRYGSCRDGDCFQARLTARRVEPPTGPATHNLTVLSEYDGAQSSSWPSSTITVNVRQRDGIAYLVRHRDGLRIVDVSTPTAPIELGHSAVAFADTEIYNDVKLVVADSRVYAVVASNLRGAVVVDVTDPTNPLEVSRFASPASGQSTVNVHSLFLDGTRMYLANVSSAGLDIFEVADPIAPLHLGSWSHPDVGILGGFVHDLFVSNGRAYLNYWNLGMVIVDTLQSPDAPLIVGHFDSYERRTSHASWVATVAGRRVAIHGDEDYGAHVRIVDVDDQSVDFLNVLAEFQTRPQVSVHNLMIVGERAYITYYQDGLRVLDLSNPAEPLEIAAYHSWPDPDRHYGNSVYEGAIGVDVDPETGLVYLADTHRGLIIVQLDI